MSKRTAAIAADDLADATAEAERQIVNRNARDRLIEKVRAIKSAETSMEPVDRRLTLADYVQFDPDGERRALAAGMTEQQARDARFAMRPEGQELLGVEAGLRRAVAELDRYGNDHRGLDSWRECALDRETIKDATIRILVERGINPTAIGRLFNPNLDSGEISSTSERKAAERIRVILREAYESQRCGIEEMIFDMRRAADLAARKEVMFDTSAMYWNSLGAITEDRLINEAKRLTQILLLLSTDKSTS